jgi:hypothetical protein
MLDASPEAVDPRGGMEDMVWPAPLDCAKVAGVSRRSQSARCRGMTFP